jgi:gentisate 1,2-dioxygenase
MLRPGEDVRPRRRSASSVFHVIEGRGQSEIDGATFDWTENDTLAIPTHAVVRHRASGKTPAFLFHVDDAPLHRKLGIYEEF